MIEDERNNDEPQQPEDEQPESPESPVPGPQDEGAEAEEAPAEAEEAPAEAEEAPAEEPAAEEPAAEAEEPAPEGEAPAEEGGPPKRRREKSGDGGKEEVIPGAHLEPDLVLEEEREQDEFAEYAAVEGEEEGAPEGEAEPSEQPSEPEPVAREPLDLAADARYTATGKRKSAVARVILRPGDGTYQINGRHLDEFFPRIKLQRMARQPLEVAGYGSRMDVAARIHGGGVAAQAGALRHGIARALVEADPNLRVELKRRGYLTRDPRVKERKKAGLKKARKRPQFSKR
jgi:small subunit ribosomal protein S9